MPGPNRPPIPASWLVAAFLAAAVVACEAGPTPALSGAPETGSPPSAAASPAVSPASPASAGPAETPLPSSGELTVVAVMLGWRLPEAISRAVAFPGDGALVLAGGLTAAGTTSSIVEISLGTGEATPAGKLPAPVHDAGGALIAGVPAVVGGGDAVAGTAVQGIRDGTVAMLGNLPKARADLSVVDLAGMTYVVGGGTTSHPDPAVLATSDGAAFSVIARLPVPVRYAAVAAVGGSIIVVGGSDGAKDRTEIQAIDPATGSATVIGHLPDALSHAAALVLDGRLVIAGGRIRGRAVDGIWVIDPATGRATDIGRLPRAVSDAAAVVVDGTGYLVGGEDADLLRTVISIAVRS